ncbi:MAG: hypothetical protein ABI295_01580, partial [Xanthomarina sp.]
LFPLYVIVEFNHGAEKLTVNNSSLDFIKKTEKSNIQPALNTKDETFVFINPNSIITKETENK